MPLTAATPTVPSTLVLDPARLRAHLPRLTRIAFRLTGSRDAAEDLVQDTLERLLRAPRTVSGDDFRYLARALRNTHIDRHRARQRRVRHPRQGRGGPDRHGPVPRHLRTRRRADHDGGAARAQCGRLRGHPVRGDHGRHRTLPACPRGGHGSLPPPRRARADARLALASGRGISPEALRTGPAPPPRACHDDGEGAAPAQDPTLPRRLGHEGDLVAQTTALRVERPRNPRFGSLTGVTVDSVDDSTTRDGVASIRDGAGFSQPG
jgi:RNA polymerase sigma factor (sigma-70 family)